MVSFECYMADLKAHPKSSDAEKERYEIGRLVDRRARAIRRLRRDVVNKRIQAAYDVLPDHEKFKMLPPKLPEIDTDRARKDIKEALAEIKRRKFVLNTTRGGTTWSPKKK